MAPHSSPSMLTTLEQNMPYKSYLSPNVTDANDEFGCACIPACCFKSYTIGPKSLGLPPLLTYANDAESNGPAIDLGMEIGVPTRNHKRLLQNESSEHMRAMNKYAFTHMRHTL